MNTYLACGENFIEKKEYIDKIYEGKSYKILSGDSITYIDLLTELESGGGLFSTELNIWIKQFDFFIYKNPTGKAKTYTKYFEELLAFIDKEFDSFDGNIVFDSSLQSSDKAIKRFAKLPVTTKEFKLPYSSGYAQWIINRAKNRYKLFLDDTAVRYLELSCTSVFEMEKELEKLDIFMDEDNRRVEGDDIINVVGAHKISGVDDLWIALLKRNKTMIIKILRNIMQTGSSEDKTRIMWFLFSHLRKIYTVASSHHLDDASLGAKIGYRGNRLFLMKNEGVRNLVSKNYSPFGVLEIIAKLTEVDFAIKQGLRGSEESIENFVFEAI